MKTLAEISLDIEAESFRVPESCYTTLENLLDRAETEIDAEDKPEKILSKIAGILKEEGFRDGKMVYLLSHGLQTKKIDCKGYSVLYFSIAEGLGLPLSIVTAPNHAFVRWNDTPNFDWETMHGGKKQTDRDYIERFNIHPKTIRDGVYLRNLAREEATAFAFIGQGVVKVMCNNIEGAIADFDESIELNPKNAIAYCNRGIANQIKGCIDKVILDCNRVINLDPDLAEAYIIRGFAKGSKGYWVRAIHDYDKAIQLNPDLESAYVARGIAKLQIGNFEEAVHDFDKAIKLNPEYNSTYAYSAIARYLAGDFKGAMRDARRYKKTKKQN